MPYLSGRVEPRRHLPPALLLRRDGHDLAAAVTRQRHLQRHRQDAALCWVLCVFVCFCVVLVVSCGVRLPDQCIHHTLSVTHLLLLVALLLVLLVALLLVRHSRLLLGRRLLGRRLAARRRAAPVRIAAEVDEVVDGEGL